MGKTQSEAQKAPLGDLVTASAKAKETITAVSCDPGRSQQQITAVFAEIRAERVAFHEPLQNREFTQAIYLARTVTAPELHGCATSTRDQ